MQYGILVWDLTYENYIKPEFLLQKQVLRAISFTHCTPSPAPISSDLKILKPHDLFQLKLLCLVHDSVNRNVPSYFHPFFHWLVLFIFIRIHALVLINGCVNF